MSYRCIDAAVTNKQAVLDYVGLISIILHCDINLRSILYVEIID